MNVIFFAIVGLAFVVAAYRQLTGGGEAVMEAMGQAAVKAAETSVTLAIGLIGIMALFLGLMKVAEAGGLLAVLAKTLRPIMQRLFPDVPPEHPAMGAMILNMSANMLGLGNAATPFGIQAMRELDKLNPHKGTATNAMVLFLAINTANVTVLPTSVLALRAAAGSVDPAGVIPTTLFATIISTGVAILVCKLAQNIWKTPEPQPVVVTEPRPRTLSAAAVDDRGDDALAEVTSGYPAWVSLAALLGIIGLIPVTILWGREISPWIIPGMIVGLLGFGLARGVKVYEVFVEGAKEGFEVAIKIIPYLVAILVAINMFRSAGAMELLISPIGAVTGALGMPAEALTMAIMRSLSGSGSYGMLAAFLKDPSIGPDSYLGYLVSTIYGSSETTFYVIAVYYGAVQVRRIRHTLAAGLLADIAAVVAAVVICLALFAA